MKTVNEEITYSYLKASIGLRLAAFRAGYQPKKIPIADEKRNDIRIDWMVMVTGQLRMLAISCETSTPSETPIKPPNRLISRASMRN